MGHMIRSCRDKDVFRLLDRQFSRRFHSKIFGSQG